MKTRMMLIAAPLVLFASQAIAENWVTVGSTGIRVDKDSIRRGSDGLVYFTDNISFSFDRTGVTEKVAMDCSGRLTYMIKLDGSLSGSKAIDPNPTSIEQAELQYVCANAP